ncbi:hypothetical protein BJY04DRAFT_226055 [Aspergillus karnatakaensis]|uniref:uncharacterized protein n=1 Tax=Aspergillus karnatakaensis TaxID=1810916 RepID=UPI003CCD51DF
MVKDRAEDFIAAIRGEKFPRRRSGKHLLCLICGIRYHPGFATELRKDPRLTKALHARSIMSNIVPDITTPNDTPYCIWHPETATEETYRKLAARYPELKYQVGRACAVAGYTKLYKELDLLPDVHIAEEARDNGSTEIYDLIMADDKYDVMNDYTRAVNTDNPPRASLNGDTAVRSSLERKKCYRDLYLWDFCYFNITEDMNIDIAATSGEDPSNLNAISFLYSPLPADISPMNKDLLILLAAYNGDIDRYVRLRRPIFINAECICIIRGIFHNTMFAKWWSLQENLTKNPSRLDSPAELRDVQSNIDHARSARFIMNNDLSRILARPETAPDLARACIVGDFQMVYEELPAFEPTRAMVDEAKNSINSFYLQDLEKRMAELGIDPEDHHNDSFNSDPIGRTTGPAENYAWDCFDKHLGTHSVHAWGGIHGIYNGYSCDITSIEASICAPDEWKTEDCRHFADVLGFPRLASDEVLGGDVSSCLSQVDDSV